MKVGRLVYVGKMPFVDQSRLLVLIRLPWGTGEMIRDTKMNDFHKYP